MIEKSGGGWIRHCICPLTSAIFVFSKVHGMLCPYTQKFRLEKHLLRKNFSVNAIKIFQNSPPTPWEAIYGTYVKSLVQKHRQEEEEKAVGI